ncbi:aminopeptidase N [Aurantiacibacter gangjinensis]|uniref:Aminopeptidase N n=1 Tax=Aurantiacibacter gangjinensis TaxID=502682 RepID=A0A0G9MLT5_9SPHN|nr:aminopeptidase N [Aurantiacibacter gangjinensis]APE27601.1 Membrane alanine aminopeptidase N [Aurantiacibacter gangjinensis]KLE31635.1 aminopeptidase N [Aurantiacibacter gangjinensis]
MDIARTPSTPDGNQHLADAAPEPQEPAIIRREDYTPFAWNLPEVHLHFELGLEETHVTAKLSVERNPQAEASPTIRLNGDELEPQSVAVDGEQVDSWTMDDGDLLVSLPGDAHEIVIETTINPAANTKLMGLFASNGMLCTQCEAEGFRRITFFPDRPDVLSVYSVRMSGTKAAFPVLLANGNLEESGEEADGTHWAEWHDPWPKPSYLFALVAGDLVSNTDTFITASGREVTCNIYVREGDEGRTGHAMESLKKSMRWDEETFGREYDLDLYNIVAVSDFNMGAMENKGLNVFNTKYVLADEETATDGDFDGVEGVIAHEYFHNWSGNRVTCRDWFQLSLKEGFTVLRDQLFSQDMGSAPVKRIEDVRVLRGAQFPEDSGPLAHPIRPDSYREISNFYTATVYNKGAEVIRMMRTMCGPERFRQGTGLYFERHDGEAATCEDFVKAMEDGAGLDLTQFRLWYSQAGTPKITARLEKDGEDAVLHLSQEVPPTPGQESKSPMPIPLRTAIFDRETGKHGGEQLVTLTEAQGSFRFGNVGASPVLSINRGFSAPVTMSRDVSDEDLVFLAAHDDDPFARYEALQDLVVGHLQHAVSGELSDDDRDSAREAIASAIGSVLADDSLDDLMRGELLVLPTEGYLAETMAIADPGRIHEERAALRSAIGAQLEDQFAAMHERASAVPYSLSAEARGARKVKTQALIYMAAGNPDRGKAMAWEQYQAADNMTDRQGALMVLAGADGIKRTNALLDFYNRFKGNALVIDKWFSLQSMSTHPGVIEHVKALADHPEFTLKNPNRVRSLYMGFAVNQNAFHDPSGEGYRVIADLILALDPINPQTAARFVTPLGRWRRIEPDRSALMKAQLERIAKAPGLSRDTHEQVSRSLG